MRAIRRLTQTASLLLFLVMLWFAAELAESWPITIFLRADPLAGALIPLADRSLPWLFAPAFLVIASALVAGRFFCGWLCPMGTTLDLGGGLVRKLSPIKSGSKKRAPILVKYLLLTGLAIAAFFGANMVFWGSPIALATRFYALALKPLLHEGFNYALVIGEPVLRMAGSMDLLYALEEPRFFNTTWFVAGFWLLLLILEFSAPRFWCHCLCPAGALLGLCALISPFRRKVAKTCINCGLCAKKCPSGAISSDPHATNHPECLVCGNCSDTCPRGAVGFGLAHHGEKPARAELFQRRSICAAAVAGASLAVLARATPASAQSVVRPPGSMPEGSFLALCLRCGECMAACPTGALQPAWFQSGFSGMFTPFLDPRSGGCIPECVACGHACPSHAILQLDLSQKRWAKMGTAIIDKKGCLAWGEDRRCMVCKENCPHNAVEVIVKSGFSVPVPVVRDDCCIGCGFCQKACPQTPAAIVVESEGALRLAVPDFETAARKAGLELGENKIIPENHELGKAPPGFLD